MILVLVFVGCTLVIAGVLFFADVKFCKDRTTAITALVSGLIMVAGSEIALIGSSSSFYKAQQIQTSACELEGETAHPESRRVDAERLIFNHIRRCMTQAGYHWTEAHEHCKEAPLASNPLCYLPSAAVDRAITSLQVAFE